MRRYLPLLLTAPLLLAPTPAFLQIAAEVPEQALSGGSFSNEDTGNTAYLHPAATLDAKQVELFALGHKMFNNRWAFFWFENAEFGRGPTSNAQACTTCHANNGRGTAPATPHADYGDQLQIFGVKGVVPAEGRFSIEWREQGSTLADGEQVRLRSPVVAITDLAYAPLGDGAMIGPRLAPPLVGLGLLEAIPEDTIVALAARTPVAGIRGKVNRVWDESQRKTVLGRFGLKANHGSIREQVANAFFNDIGLSSPVYPEQNCPPVQQVCKEQMVAGKPEITTLRLAGLTIRPYTDLLLHDMGDGLADGRPDFLAGAAEWRTPPLWGIGLSETVNGANAFLHDGRARNFTEAILWHGGEANASREAFSHFTREDRAALVAFLGSL